MNGSISFRLTAAFTFLLLHIIDTPTQAQQGDVRPSAELELLKEEETVSIASRYEQPISEAPSNVYVITDEDIRHSGAPDLPTVLRRIPGIEVMQVTGAEFNVSARGNNQLTANKMLVMVDGRSIYIDVQGEVFWKAIPVTLPEIKRIEVLKGPASAIYGFNAFDGVINIITKTAQDMKGTTIQFGGGEFGTISSAAVHAGTAGRLGYRLSLGEDQNQQWRNKDALAFRSYKFNVQTEYALKGDSRVLFSGGVVDSNRYDGVLSETVLQTGTPQLGYAHASYERRNLIVRAFWNSYSNTSNSLTNPLISSFLKATDRNGSSLNKSRADTYNIDLQHMAELTISNRFTYGLNYRHNTYSSNFLSSFSQEDRLGFFIQDEWNVTKALDLVAGLRYDLHTQINSTFSPRFAVLYKLAPNHSLRMTVSMAYRPPTLFESYADVRGAVTLPPPIPSPAPTLVPGSVNIGPEKIISYDAGYQGWFLQHRMRMRFDLFFNHISDLINNRPTAPGIAPFVNDPGQADIYGGEAGVEFLATSWLSTFANYSYEEIGQSFTDTTRRGAPRSKFNAGVRGEVENGLSGEITFHYVSAATYPIAGSFTTFSPFFPPGVAVPNTRVGSYNLLNMRAGYRFWQQKAAAGYMRDAEVAVSVFNALNDEHKEHPLGDLISRRVMGWLTVRF